MPSKTRILIAECRQEVSTFNPVRSHYGDFAIKRGAEIVRYHRGRRSEIGGALAAFATCPDVEVVPAYAARQITSGGTLAGTDFRRIAREFLAAVRKALPVDAVYVSVHGAMAAEGELDPEGHLLEQTRRLVGEGVPIVFSADLHGVPTDRMLENCDGHAMFHTYPHTDFFETGERAGRLLLRILFEGARPVTAKVTIPALVRGDELITKTGLFGRCIREAQKVEAGRGGLIAGMYIGNPFTDVPELQSYSIVTTDGDERKAEREAIRIARQFWSHRKKMQVPLTSVKESVRIAARTKGTTAMVDAADATSSGASGDSNEILRELVRSGYRGKALIPIVDPGAVKAAFAAGVGRMVRTKVGGALDRRRFKPLPVKGRVRMLSDGAFLSETFKDRWHSGPTAVIDVDNFTIIATTRPVSLYDRALFLAHGRDPKDFDLVVVKSPNCEPHMFREWCTMVDVDADGSTSANLPRLGHTQCPRPIFPLDRDVVFSPVAKLFYERARARRTSR